MSTLEDKEGYKTAFKSTSVYGGVQVITIIIGVIRSKLTAMWLGVAGFGILSILNSTIQLIANFSNLGLASSAVREISKAPKDNVNHLAEVITAISRCVILTGCVGSLFTVLMSSKISYWTFGSGNYALAYIWLASVVIINNIYSGHYALLQGLRRINFMAKAKILGSIFGLLIIIPCYFFWGQKGIVPSLVLSAIASLIISRYFTLKLNLPRIKQTIKQSLSIGKSAIQLGIMMMITGLIALLVELIIKTYIIKVGSLSEVGLYQAGWAINTQYLGMVFTAMATDYYPRLTQSFKINDIASISLVVNQQSEIALLILAPLICGMLVFLPLVIQILYTSEFLGVVDMTKLLLLGSLIKSGSWAISFIFLAAGDGKLFMFNEVGISLLNLLIYLIGYKMGGLLGIGYAFVVSYIIYFSWVTILAKKKYNFLHSRLFRKIIMTNIFLCLLSYFMVTFIDNNYVANILGVILFLASCIYSFFELDKRLDIISYFKLKK